ncbi:MAG: FkbM family methyltransferase [Gaiellaceae bacterium]
MRAALVEVGVPPIVLADIGARGDVPEPWDAFGEKDLEVIGFEPDEEECARLNARSASGRRFFPMALWSEDGLVDLHLASYPGCSSIHSPNGELLERYAEQHGAPRQTMRISSVVTTTLDRIVATEELDIDFLKIDTQGAEYEILLGARRTLKSQAIGVLVETWTAEVHRGQHLSGEVMTLLRECGFELFDVGIAAAWRRRIVDTTSLLGKSQVIGLDLLCFREPDNSGPKDCRAKVAKLAAVAAIYGFPDFALEVTETAEGLHSLRDAILASSRPSRPSLGERFRDRAVSTARGLRSKTDYPSLHT